MHLSKHFTLAEATKSHTALRLGIDNTPDDVQKEAMVSTAINILEPVRMHYNVGIIPSSWLRVEELERAICWGGSEKSSFARWCRRRELPIDENSWGKYFVRKSHPKGESVDFEVPGVSNLDLAKWCRDNLDFDQLILEFHNPLYPHSGWLHGSFSVAGNRADVLTIGPGINQTGLPGD